ncbi:MAG: cysteine synthase [Proteobacteria bacterium]|nr:cysteine synthase [Pseudomonadota bacterium]
MIFKDVLSRIGNTPLVEITRLNPFAPDVKILAKIECVNPGGSIKDRVALSMIEAAEASGELTPDKTIIEATSGNTGIGLAMVAAIKGYYIILLMSERASEERKMIMRAYGAGIMLTPGHLSTDGAIELAYRMYREEPEKYVLMDQFNNPASIDAHYKGTGKEIWDQTDGTVTHVVVTLGTTGTCMGITKRMRKESDTVKVLAVEPYAGHKLQGLKNMLESYPPGIWDRSVPDEVIHVDDESAFELVRRLAREEGIFAGMSSGAALGGALKVAQQLAEAGQSGTVVTIFPDSGERYLSTPLFAPKSDLGVKLWSMDSGGLKTLAFDQPRCIFTIGPSLDNLDDPDAWKRMVLADVLARFLEANGCTVNVAVGLADMDDRALKAARKAGLKGADFAANRVAALGELAGRLGVRPATIFVTASSGGGLCVELPRKLMGKGLAYEKLRSVYFDVARDKRYGTMASMDMDKVSAGRTVDLDAYVKDNPKDFTLLKRASLQDLKDGEVLETEWGNVRPSWFLQIAAAGAASLDKIDVCLVSDAHRFPHMENLRALFAVAGKEPQVWMMDLQVGEDEGVGLEELLAKAGNLRALRMWLLSGTYRKPLAATDEALAMWVKNWSRVQEAAGALVLAQGRKKEGESVPAEAEQAVYDLRAGFAAAMEADLSLHQFWPVLFKFTKEIKLMEAAGRLTSAAARHCLRELRKVDGVLCVLDETQLPLPLTDLPEEVRTLVAKRTQARDAKDFQASDSLRDQIATQGYRVEDTAQGVRVFRG